MGGLFLCLMATQTEHTVSEIAQIVSDLRGESTVNTGSSRIRAISRAEQDFARRRLWKSHLLANVTTTGDGTNDYAAGSTTYPMRNKGLTEVFVGGTTEDKRYQVIDYVRFKAEFNKNNSSRVAYEWYDTANDLWKMHISPAPETGVTIYYTYFWTPPTRTLTTDEVICGNPEIIAYLASAQIYEGEDEDQKAILARQQAERLIDEQIGDDNMPAVNQTYAMGAIENSGRPQGFGTY